MPITGTAVLYGTTHTLTCVERKQAVGCGRDQKAHEGKRYPVCLRLRFTSQQFTRLRKAGAHNLFPSFFPAISMLNVMPFFALMTTTLGWIYC